MAIQLTKTIAILGPASGNRAPIKSQFTRRAKLILNSVI